MAVYKRINTLLLFTAAIFFAFISFLIKNKHKVKVNDFSSVDFRSPPPCVDFLREAIRLNELLAYTQYDCSSKLRVPDESHSFFVCVEKGFEFELGNNANFIAITNSFDDLDFELGLLRTFNATGHIFMPKKQKVDFARKNLVFHHGIMVPSSLLDSEVESKKYLSVKDLRSVSKNIARVDVLKFDCTNCWQLADTPKLLSEIIAENLLFNIRQFNLVIRLEENSNEILYSWYKVLHDLYYFAKFALFSAVQMGECGRTVIHCQYKLSFVKMPSGKSFKALAPINGMGFPEEEIGRLLTYINYQNKNYFCDRNLRSIKINSVSWTICALNPAATKLNVYYFTYNASLENFQDVDDNINVFLFDPTLTLEQCDKLSVNSGGKIKAKSLTVADEKSGLTAPGYNKNGREWKLTSLNKLINEFNLKENDIDLLIVDLNGGEWDIFEQILKPSNGKIFRQFVIRLRIFYGEENENYRQLYSWFVRLENSGWKIFHTNPYSSNLQNCRENSCYEMGWTR